MGGRPQPQNLLGGPANLAAPDSWGGEHCEEPLETLNTLSLEMRQGRRWLDYGQLLPGSSLTTGPYSPFCLIPEGSFHVILPAPIPDSLEYVTGFL